MEQAMDNLDLLIDLYRHARRLGPGSDEATTRALELTGLDTAKPLRVADIGCGSGASALVLARLLNARITAVDCFGEFLDQLTQNAEAAGLSDRITTLCCAMEKLPFETGSLDLIWSEGAIYNIGFERGVRDWRPYLREGGLLVVSEITWTTATRPAALQRHWETEYPEIDLASSKLRILEQQGYSPVGYFVLPEACWLENYYQPLQESFQAFLERNADNSQARELVEEQRREIALYQANKTYYSYGFYVASKQADS